MRCYSYAFLLSFPSKPPQVILASEAFREEAINRASGEAEAILRNAEATAKVRCQRQFLAIVDLWEK